MVLRKLFHDFLALRQVVGLQSALKWLALVCLMWRAVIADRNLQAADRRMGSGPFEVRVRPYEKVFRVCGPQAFSGIREMYARNVYLRGGLLKIEAGDVVLDLGANMGNFTCLVLAAHADTRVVAVEPSLSMNQIFIESVGKNHGFLERVKLLRGFVGTLGGKQARLIAAEGEDYAGAPSISEDELLEVIGDRIDFLKCDIEGGEFGLLVPGSRFLEVTRKLACEVHAFAGDVQSFLNGIRRADFEILFVQRDPDGSATFLAERRQGDTAPVRPAPLQ